MIEKSSATGAKPDPYDVDFSAALRAVPVKGVLAAAAAALAAVYVLDFAYIHAIGDRFDTVTVSRVYSEALKNNKIDFSSAGSSDVQCVKALFPHFGDSPCWYLQRHKQVIIDM